MSQSTGEPQGFDLIVLSQEADQNDDVEEDLTVTHRKHLRFFGIRWRYWRMSIAVLISVCFAVAGIVLHDKARGVVRLLTEQNACSVMFTTVLQYALMLLSLHWMLRRFLLLCLGYS